MSYSSYDRDKLETADQMRIERNIYFEESKADISALTALPIGELSAMREKSAAAEQAIFEQLQAQAAAWEEQAGKTLMIDKAIEYARTREVAHTSNKWEQPDEYRHERSNRVYKMYYRLTENTRYDSKAGKSVPYSYTLTWGVYTNGPGGYGGAKIAGQDKKVFATKAEMEKYLNGRIKAYTHLFTEISPPIPKEYAEHFKVNGQLLPGYTIEGDAPQEQRQEKQPDAQPEPRPVTPIVLTSEKPADKLKEITDRLEQGITELFNSERYKEYLCVMSRFHNYSFNNTLLIALQKPDASLIAGFSAWKNNFGRNVMKGEKGIKILAPSPFKVKKQMQKIDPDTRQPIIGRDGKPVTEEQEITVPAFKVVSVFDVSQTEGRELPQIGVNELTGEVDRYKEFFAALEKTSPVPIAFEKIGGGAHGYYHLEEKRIAIDEGMSELQTIKTAIHEVAHAKLHAIDPDAPKDGQNRTDRRTREVEAESVAYTVCQHYGLDTSDYSFGYVAGWSSGRELSELKGSLETIRKAAAEIINSIDGQLAALQKTQEKAAQQPDAPAPDRLETGEQVRTPRGSFYVTAMTREQMEAAGYGFHHQSEDGKYLIMANGTRAFAIATQPENPLKSVEQTAEQNYNMIDGVLNNAPSAAELEAKIQAGEQISLADYASALKAEQAQGREAKATEKKPSIRAQLAAAKKQAAPKKAAEKSQNHEMEV